MRKCSFMFVLRDAGAMLFETVYGNSGVTTLVRHRGDIVFLTLA